MPRVIAGTAGGRRLAVPPGTGTRPSSDRVKEAMFSSLTSDPGLAGARVLDLFAGSGGLGLEAASRGATAVRLVESDPGVLAVIRANVATVGVTGIEVVAEPVARHLSRMAPPDGFDVVLLDPPYSLDVRPVLALLADGGWIAPGGVVVCERSSRSAALGWPAPLVAVRDRRYGETTLWYGRRP